MNTYDALLDDLKLMRALPYRKRTAEEQRHLDDADERYGDGWWTNRATRWRLAAVAVGEFAHEHGGFPVATAIEPRSDTEHRLGAWLKNQRTLATGMARDSASFTAQRRAFLDEVAPGWSLTPEALWYQTADRAADFIREHGDRPRRGGAGDEGELGKWISRQQVVLLRQSDRIVDADAKTAYLDENAHGWRVTVAELAHFDNAAATAEFLRRNNRWPAWSGKSAEERTLGNWLAHYRMRNRRGGATLTDDRLDKIIPGWREAGTVEMEPVRGVRPRSR